MRSTTSRLSIGILALALAMLGCRERESSQPPPAQPRDRLTSTELTEGNHRGAAPLDNRYFTPLGRWDAARHELEGTLTVPELVMHRSGEADATDPQGYFPGFTLDFFTHGKYLVPVSRDSAPRLGDRSYWHILVSPGTVWSEPDDGGRSRASFPFALVSDVFNEVHNGVATFVYDEAQVSPLSFQVTQETAPWNKTDFWGVATMRYTPHPIDDRSLLAARFAQEEQRRIPVLPFSELGNFLDAAMLDAFNAGIEPEEVSATGLIWKGKLYLQPCYTRYGEFPYCTYMRHGAFSLTKAMGALVALLRLAEKFGDDVLDLEVADYVGIAAAHSGWESVTFADALNMATGVGDNVPERVDPNVMQGDEEQPKFFSFMRARSLREKLDIAFSYGDYPWGPGEVARYNSINTLVLAAAMDSLLKRNEGPDADIWEMVVREVYEPIGIAYAPIMRTVEPDQGKGLPIFGYGMYPNVDDLAKLSILFHNGGRHGERQLLHAGRLAESMFRTEVTGLPTGESSEYGSLTYHLAFNGLPYRNARGQIHRIAVSTGFGGNHWVLAPNGITAFRFSDANQYGVGSMVDAANALAALP